MALDVRAGVGADHRGLWRETTDQYRTLPGRRRVDAGVGQAWASTDSKTRDHAMKWWSGRKRERTLSWPA